MTKIVSLLVGATSAVAILTSGPAYADSYGNASPGNTASGETKTASVGKCVLYGHQRSMGADCIAGNSPRHLPDLTRLFRGGSEVCRYLPLTDDDEQPTGTIPEGPGNFYVRTCLVLADAADPNGEFTIVKRPPEWSVERPPSLDPVDEAAWPSTSDAYPIASIETSPEQPRVYGQTNLKLGGGDRYTVVRRGIYSGPALGYITMRAQISRTSIDVTDPDDEPVFASQGPCILAAPLLSDGECVRMFRHSTAIFGDDGEDDIDPLYEATPQYIVQTEVTWQITYEREDNGPIPGCAASPCVLGEFENSIGFYRRVYEVQTLNR